MDIDDGCARNKYKCNHAKSRGRLVYRPPPRTVNCLLMALPSARPATSSILQHWIEIILFSPPTLSSEKEYLTGEKYGSHRRMSSGGGIHPTGARRECKKVFFVRETRPKRINQKNWNRAADFSTVITFSNSTVRREERYDFSCGECGSISAPHWDLPYINPFKDAKPIFRS